MPRQGTKRKFDGPVAAIAIVPLKKARKSKSRMSTAGDEDEGACVKMSAAGKRDGEEDEKRDDVDEDEDEDEYHEESEEGMTDTQQLLAIVQFGSKEKREAAREAGAYSQRFRETLEQCAAGLRRVIEERGDDADKKDAEFLKMFKAAYALASPFALQANGDVYGSFATLYERSKALTASAQALIESYEHACERVAGLDMKGLMENNWDEEDRALAKLLAAGKRVAAHKYQSILSATKPQEQQRLSADEARAEKLLYDDEAAAPSEWGKVARKQEKAARRLARAVERVDG